MKGVVVSDTSPVCYLIETDIVEYLPRLFTEVLVPPAVIERFADRGWDSFDEVIARLRLTTFRYNEQIISDIRERLRVK